MKKSNRYIRILATMLLLLSAVSAMALGKRESKTVQVGETFTVTSSGHTNLHSVLWKWDTGCLELVSNLYGTSTSATFKAKKATPTSGVVIQATVYYYASVGSVATGKFFDDWTIYVEDNTTVSLDQGNQKLSPGDSFTLNASANPSSYSGSYTWSSSRPSVAVVSGYGNRVSVKAYSAGQTTIRVTLDNGKYAECFVNVEDNATVSLSPSRKDVSTGDSFTLQANTSPPNYGGTFTWKSSDTSVARCSGSGSSANISACGDGKSTITVSLSNGATATCDVYVTDVEVTDVSISDMSVEVEKSLTLKANIYPNNATVKKTEWIVDDGNDIVKFSGSSLTGLKPGKAKVHCLVNGTKKSNTATVSVTEPPLTFISGNPADGNTGVSPFVKPAATYSHAITIPEGTTALVCLYSSEGNVKGTVSVSDKKMTFTPDSPLKPLTRYSLSIPSLALTNKWGSNASSDVLISFTTSDYENVTVEASPSSGTYLTKSDRITLKANPDDAEIFYTLDGTEPSLSSQRYSEPIAISADVTLKAFAVREGYHNSETFSAQYYKSQTEIEGYYPNYTEPFFNYSGIVPHLILSGEIEKSNNFRRISLKEKDGTNVAGQPYLTKDMVVFVPDEPLENCKTYTVDIPRDALKTSNGEIFKGYSWTFTTPEMTVDVAMQGDESVFVLTENGRLSRRGMEYSKTTPSDGSFTFKDNDELTASATEVDDIACGYFHNLIRKGQTLTASGLAFCGETATSASLQKLGNAKVIKAGFQTSAIIDDDNTLWMAGRNDFYQLGDSTGSVAKEFVKISDNVLDVALGNGYTLFVDTDNVLWGVGRNHRGQLGDSTTVDRRIPVMIIEGVEKAYASANGYFSACLTTDNRLLIWGDNSSHQLGRGAEEFSATPEVILNGIESASLGEAHALAVTDKYELLAWGSNAYGQVSSAKGNIDKPTIIANNVRTAVAGPHTSLILSLSDKVEGWGLRTHSNFGKGDGNASGFIVEEGREYSALEKVTIYPARFEARPDEEFALAALPVPASADYDAVEWRSDNPDIASVEGNGVIHTHELGETVVTVTYTDRFGIKKEASAAIKCTQTPDNTYVSTIQAESSDWNAYAQGSNIIIDNTVPGAVFTIFNLQGLMIKRVLSEGIRLIIPSNSEEPYIVKSGSKAVKVICQ